MAKNMAGWKQGGTPEGFLLEGRMTRNPRKMAQAQMDAFENKVKDIIGKLPAPVGDPLQTLRLAMERWQGSCQDN